MYAIAFDLVVADTEQHHPKGVSQAYAEIGVTLAKYGFRRVQGSLYVSDDENMAQLFVAIQSLWEPVGLKGNRLQSPLVGPDFAAFLGNRTTIARQNRRNLASPIGLFASIP